MVAHDLASVAQYKTGIAAQSIAGGATVNGASFQPKGSYLGLLVAQSGLVDTGGCTVKLQDSADDAAWTDITSASISFAATDDNVVKVGQIHLRRYRKYMRVVAVNGAGAAGTLMAASVVLYPSANTAATVPDSAAFDV